ncbi:hypothetical protein Pla52nx_004692 [Stieleria varia]|uniref:hypothetical protein n=1 Tax=Stieleria varia TaxID=2528005 RepID=UPI00313E18AE
MLPELNREECSFLGALVALRTMCDHAPLVVRGHIFDSEIDEWQENFETWADRCKKKIEKRNVLVDDLKSKAAEEFERLKAVSEDRPKAMWLADVKADLASIENRPL